MYKSFSIRNFKCFPALEISGLQRVNLIAGKNNVGKTALLEALFVSGGPDMPDLTHRIGVLRGISRIKADPKDWAGEAWKALFHDMDVTCTISLASVHENGELHRLDWRLVGNGSDLHGLPERVVAAVTGVSEVDGLPDVSGSGHPQVAEFARDRGGAGQMRYMFTDGQQLRVDPPSVNPEFLTHYVTAQHGISVAEDAGLFSEMERQGNLGVLTEALSAIEPELTRLSLVMLEEQPIVHGYVGLPQPLPLSLLGTGMTRLVALMMRVAASANGVLLIDEIENGFHHTVLPKVWRAIDEAARKFNTQIFATTHSYECIMAAHEAFSQSEEYDFRLQRLERVKGEIKAIPYDREMLEATYDTGLEMR